MRKIHDTMLLSASDLMRFMGCRHATTLDLTYLQGRGPQPREDSEDVQLLQKQGDIHEAKYLAKLKAAGTPVVEIARGEIAHSAAATREALAEGAEIIFQGAFLSGSWGGWSDFLERVEKPSDLGDFSYEVTDTKLKRKPHPKHVLQLVLYSDLLAKIQGVMPEYAYVQLGDGTRAPLKLADYVHYARAARERLEAFVATPRSTRPIPCADCALCRWGDHCADVWLGEDSLFNIAGISRGQIKKIEAAGITTMTALATHEGPVRGMVEATLEKLTVQARLQHARKIGSPEYKLRSPESGKGFYLLPEPQAGDLFYDVEGDPYCEGGLEYLHGIWFDDTFRSFWAHDHSAEKAALADLLYFVRTRLTEYPHARIYHYAPYEITALRRLTMKYGIEEAFFDRLLREQRFVDLYAVVRGGLTASEPNYSLKSIEVFYNLKREGEVKTASGSIVAYERWRETNEQEILNEIENYNLLDCQSTEKLRDWLVSIRPDDTSWPIRSQGARDKEEVEDAEVRALRRQLASAELPQDRQEMLLNLGLFHKREAKPAWWAIFDSLGREDEELIDNLDALAGLKAITPATPIRQSKTRTYSFPPQDTKLRGGQRATVPSNDGFDSVEIEEIDRGQQTATLKIGKDKASLLADRLTLHPSAPFCTKVIATALSDVIKDQLGVRRYRAVNDLLSRAVPRLNGGLNNFLNGTDLVAETIDAVHQMDETVLPIQGPPGTGKTYLTARVILSLVRAGYRVGVTSNSHEAIRNVLLECCSAVDEYPSLNLSLVHKMSGQDDGYPDDCPVRRTSNNDEAAAGTQVVGGTAFFFSRDQNIQAYDWLFVDEAGQVGLANMVAKGRAARNIVLVGDPRQLPQVIQGAHPDPANLSCLEWMLGDHLTVPDDRGIFLKTTRRMHPDICRFISDQIYESRLTNYPDTARQAVSGAGIPDAGAYWVSVEHEGNAQVSTEEVEAIRVTAEGLMRCQWTEKDGTTRPLRSTDIIVVAPYNAQVNALREALPAEIRVGTVDKFQGQESPVCLVSMTASSAEESPRGMEFLFSLNRINVAVSRAKALALVFGSPRLLEAKCGTVEQMKLVNTLCALPKLESN